jgi:hypothetical protein
MVESPQAAAFSAKLRTQLRLMRVESNAGRQAGGGCRGTNTAAHEEIAPTRFPCQIVDLIDRGLCSTQDNIEKTCGKAVWTIPEMGIVAWLFGIDMLSEGIVLSLMQRLPLLRDHLAQACGFAL